MPRHAPETDRLPEREAKNKKKKREGSYVLLCHRFSKLFTRQPCRYQSVGFFAWNSCRIFPPFCNGSHSPSWLQQLARSLCHRCCGHAPGNRRWRLLEALCDAEDASRVRCGAAECSSICSFHSDLFGSTVNNVSDGLVLRVVCLFLFELFELAVMQSMASMLGVVLGRTVRSRSRSSAIICRS